jgi:hypothetical protein
MVNLTDDELLVLFEFLSRFSRTKRIYFVHYSEALVLDSLLGDLERRLVEPFHGDYFNLLLSARSRVVDSHGGYEGRDDWLQQLTLESDLS